MYVVICCCFSFFLSFFSVCMYDLAYIMHNHILFLLFFFLAIFAKSPARGASNAQHTCKCLCARIPQCVYSCVCVWLCPLCYVYVWVERRSLHHSQTLSPFVVGGAKPMLRCTALPANNNNSKDTLCPAADKSCLLRRCTAHSGLAKRERD